MEPAGRSVRLWPAARRQRDATAQRARHADAKLPTGGARMDDATPSEGVGDPVGSPRRPGATGRLGEWTGALVGLAPVRLL